MSRIGKKPIPVPKGVKVAINGTISVEGPKGKLTVPVPAGVTISEQESNLVVERENDSYAANHGLARALLANAVNGVSQGFTRVLEIVGIGYRCDLVGRVLMFSLGYSHPIEFLLPEGVDAKVEKQTVITLSSHDRQLLGQTAANIRLLRKPDVYKNKGIRYQGEKLQKKEGKAGGR